ncbi:Pr6Pr family membrane protein [Rubellimicrobium roseum]|uniref:FAR-17a/AIG1-like protein n=1 Tax=Rubellimicrobium roseum TaxID=687525 RepID=A0A5C4N8F0_9RHOB|nr:Pr6Pr family membrane protein [Rubellimicrobium roseum]TNC70317.1 hypothetical protein FHG71_13055 [Rubellimicrobium roseum]
MPCPRLTPAARLLSLLVAAVAGGGLAAQALGSAEFLGRAGWPLLWHLSSYFTILTALLVAATTGAEALTGRAAPPGWSGGLTVWSLMAGVAYHALLSGLWTPQGPSLWADHALHLALPALMAAQWLATPRPALTVRHALLWLLWPLAYLLLTLARGALTGSYPYPFLDPHVAGVSGLLGTVVALGLAFLLMGLALVSLSHSRRAPASAASRP